MGVADHIEIKEAYPSSHKFLQSSAIQEDNPQKKLLKLVNIHISQLRLYIEIS